MEWERLEKVIHLAMGKGTTACDLFAVQEEAIEVEVRAGRVEKLKRSKTHPVGLRAFVGSRVAVSCSSDATDSGLAELASTAVAMARVMEEDPHAGLPEAAAGPLPEVSSSAGVDESPIDFPAEKAIAFAKELDSIVLGADERVRNTDSSWFQASHQTVRYLDSRNRRGTYGHSEFMIGSKPVAQVSGSMQTGFWWSASTKLSGLDAVEAVGREAVRRTVRKLGARKIKTCRVPVLFEAEAAGSLLGHLCQALSGTSVYLKASFFAEAIGKQIFPKGIEITDDATRAGGLASRPFDGEGIPSRKIPVVADGMLRSFLLDSYSARRLGRTTTASAARSPAGGPAPRPTNFFLAPGNKPALAILRSVKRGLYVTDLMGMGINPVTGDYSRGASGIWIEGGEWAHPVEEVTVSGNLRDLFAGIEAVGSELRFQEPVVSPALLIGEMTVAGS